MVEFDSGGRVQFLFYNHEQYWSDNCFNLRWEIKFVEH